MIVPGEEGGISEEKEPIDEECRADEKTDVAMTSMSKRKQQENITNRVWCNHPLNTKSEK